MFETTGFLLAGALPVQGKDEARLVDWFYWLVFFAQQRADGAGKTPGTGDGGGSRVACGGPDTLIQFAMIGGIFVVFYFLLIRPQQKRQRKHQEMLGQLRRGDTVYTQGGIYGRVVNLTDNTVTLEVAKVDNREVRIRVLRSAVGGKQTPAADGGEAKDAESIRQTQKDGSKS